MAAVTLIRTPDTKGHDFAFPAARLHAAGTEAMTVVRDMLAKGGVNVSRSDPPIPEVN